MVSFMAFCKQGFGVLLHRLLHSVLQHYCLELYNMIPSGILHITTFVTMCETYMGTKPHFDVWKYFFYVRRL
jgi:hypothetical protein